MEQACSKCHHKKPLTAEYFNKKHSSPTGYDRICKECKKAYDRKRYEERKKKQANRRHKTITVY